AGQLATLTRDSARRELLDPDAELCLGKHRHGDLIPINNGAAPDGEIACRMSSQPPFDRAEALSKIEQALKEVVVGIGLCLKAGLHIPALILLYSGVDIAGWMASDDPTTTVRDSFTAWVD